MDYNPIVTKIKMPKKSLDVQCSFCPKTYCNQQVFYKHANRAHFQEVSDSWYPCEICQMYLPSQETLKKHRACVHSVKEVSIRIQCTFCQRSHCNNHEFYKHANRVHAQEVARDWFSCDGCNVLFPDEDVLKNHKFQAHSNSGNEVTGRVSCPFCTKHFSRTVEFYKHANSAHLPLILMDWIQCDQCEMFFPRSDVLERHTSRVHSTKKNCEQNVQCFFCDFIFNNLKDLYIHANDEHKQVIEISWEKCEDCPLFFPDSWDVESHRIEDHQQLDPLLAQVDFAEQEDFKCPSCDFASTTDDQICTHFRDVHAGKPENKKSRKRHSNLAKSQISSSESNSNQFDSGSNQFQDFLPSLEEQFENHNCPQTANPSDLGEIPASTSHIDPVVIKSESRYDQFDSSPNWVRCLECETLFPGPHMLKVHVTLHHSQNDNKVLDSHSSTSNALDQEAYSSSTLQQKSNPNTDNSEIISESDPTPWPMCTLCGRVFTNQIILNAHLAYAHQQIANEMKPSIQLIDRISTCGTSFSITNKKPNQNPSSCSTATDDDPSAWPVCPLCRRAFTTQLILNAHLSYVHQQIPDEALSDCNIGKKLPREIQQNQKKLNEQNQGNGKSFTEFFCDFCGIKFTDLKIYLTHANLSHAAGVAVKWKGCDLCPAFLPSQDQLEVHKTTLHNKSAGTSIVLKKIKLEANSSLTTNFSEQQPIFTSDPSKESTSGGVWNPFWRQEKDDNARNQENNLNSDFEQDITSGLFRSNTVLDIKEEIHESG